MITVTMALVVLFAGLAFSTQLMPMLRDFRREPVRIPVRARRDDATRRDRTR